MQLEVQVVDADDEVRDLVVDLPDDATVGDLGRALGAGPGSLYAGSAALDDGTPLAGGPVHCGDRLGLGRPVPQPPAGTWEVRVGSGPDAGAVHRLSPGEYDVHGVRLVVTEAQVRAVDGEFTPYLRAGGRLLSLTRTDPYLRRTGGPTVAFHRRPRLLPPAPTTLFRLPAPPAEADRPGWPWLVVLLPLLLGTAAYLLTHAWQTLLFLALSPLMAIGSAVTGRRQHRRRERRERRAHAEQVAAVTAAATEAARRDTERRRACAPDPAAVLDVASRPDDPRLWQRRPGDPDFLHLRLGTADQPSAVRLVDPTRAEHEAETRWMVPDLPVTVDLGAGGLGVVGPPDVRRALGAWLVGQAAALHAPDDLAIECTEPWARWLPHRRAEAALTLTVVDGRGEAGLPAIWLAEREADLPAGCGVVAVAQADGTLVVRRDGADTLEGVRPDLVVDGWIDLVARALAPLRSAGRGGTALPDRCALSDLLEPARLLAQWGASTRAVVGAGPGGAPYVVDLARDGPHALIAGTTGAGKSELLRTLVMSLALANRPDALAFVLVDYKGGAAFRGCERLPHVAGLVTDLDPRLTRRALASLSAELRRRERVLAEAGASDIAELPDGRLARLVIVVDEFATLAADLPDFVAGLVDIARRGRSLGVHLVLATQRPSGVVTPEIRSNTALRIALRVTDPEDSTDVVAVPDAARIPESKPGRALVRRSGGAVETFQVARLVAPATTTRARVRPLESEPPPDDGDRDDALAGLVEAILAATTRSGAVPPASPWLPPLPGLVDRSDLDGGPGIPFALVDRPAEQSRATATLDLVAGRHLAVVGAARSGRTEVLRTIAAGIAARHQPDEVHLHVLDCGGADLLPLAALPHVGVVATRDQHRRVQRLTDRLTELVRDRQADPGDEARPRVVVLLDRWESFHQCFDGVDGGRLVEAWQQLLRDGPGVGLTAVVTGDRSLLTGRMGTLLDDVLLLRASDPGDYAAVGVTARDAPREPPPGRGFTRAAEEAQVALTTAEELARLAAPHDDPRAAFTLDDLPTRIDRASAERVPPGQDGLLLALGGDRLGGRSVPLRGGFLVVGARRSGRSSALVTLARSALAARRPVHVVTPRGGPLGALEGVRDDLELDAEAVLLVDDLDTLDPDSPTAAAVARHLDRVRDGPGLVAAAGAPAELAATYRGPAVTLRRGGCGLLLDPRAAGDADILGVRLPRSAYSARLPPGGGYLVEGGEVEQVQVVAPG